jgi:hypothetical protein
MVPMAGGEIDPLLFSEFQTAIVELDDLSTAH